MVHDQHSSEMSEYIDYYISITQNYGVSTRLIKSEPVRLIGRLICEVQMNQNIHRHN